MGWLRTKFTSSFFALFASSHPVPGVSEVPCGLEDIREAMLALLDGMESSQVERRISYAHDIQGLWYLRGDLMYVLAGRLGEAQALEKIIRITAMFQHMLPSGLKARPSPLNPQSPASFQSSAD